MSEPVATDFVVTKEYRRFQEFLAACRRYRYIGLCYGPAGVGKTLSARHYAGWDELEALLDDRYYGKVRNPTPEMVAHRSALYTPEVTNTPRRIAEDVRLLCGALDAMIDAALDPAAHRNHARERPRHTGLLIVDEADRLKTASLEQLRDFYDRRPLGLVLIGMPGIEKRLARYPQLYSRIGFVHHYRTLGTEELRFILAHKWAQLGLAFSPDDFTDAETLAAIARITGGNFRLVQRLFAQIERVLEINHLRTVTKEVVEAARESLVIGPLG